MPRKATKSSKPKAAKEKEPEIYVARSTGVVRVDGKLTNYYGGTTRVRAGHPLLKAAPNAFVPMKLDYDIEQATKAPGEKRGN
jgi:hypothetical protein